MASRSKWYDCAHCDAGYLEQACTCRNAADLDGDGYPTDATLTRIAAWPYTDMKGLAEYVRHLWHWPTYARKRGNRYIFATGGWSGNEALIGALEQNLMFWAMSWESSQRGGRYVFEVPTVKENKDEKRKDAPAKNRRSRAQNRGLGRGRTRRPR